MSKKIYSFLLGGAVALAAFAATEFVGNGTVVKNDMIEDYKPIFAEASASVTDQTITVTYDLSSNAQILIHNQTDWESVVAADYGKTNTNIVVTCVVNGVTKTETKTAGTTGSFTFENLEAGTYPVSLTAAYQTNSDTKVTPVIADQVVEAATPSEPKKLYLSWANWASGNSVATPLVEKEAGVYEGVINPSEFATNGNSKIEYMCLTENPKDWSVTYVPNGKGDAAAQKVTLGVDGYTSTMAENPINSMPGTSGNYWDIRNLTNLDYDLLFTANLNTHKLTVTKYEAPYPEPETPAHLYMLDAEGNTLATLKQEGETAIISGDYQKVTDSGVDFIISDKEGFVEGAQYLKLAGTYGSGDYESWLNPNDDYTNKVATLLDSKPTELNHFDTADLALYNISVDWSNKEVTITKVREYTKTIDEPTFTYEVYNNVIILTVTAPASGAIMDGGTEIATMDYKNTHFQVYLKVGETALNENTQFGDDIMGGATYTKTYTGVYGETLACTAKVIGVNLIDKTMNESVVLPTAALEINTPTLDTDLNNVTVEWGAFTVSNENVTFQVFVLSKDNARAIVWQSEAGLTGNSAKIPSNKFEYDVQYDIMVVATWSYGTADASKEFDGITGIDALTVDGAAVYFDVNGRQVVNPENGLYIRVANGKAQKMIIRK